MANEITSSEASLVGNLLNTIIRLQNHLRLYGENNANIEQTTAKLLDLLGQLFESEDPVLINVARHGFIYDGVFVERQNRSFASFANHLFQHGIAVLILHKGILARAIYGFLALVNRKPSETWDDGGMENCLRLRNIELLEVREMAEHDFILDVTASENEPDQQTNKSELWERLAFSLAHEHRFADADLDLVRELSPAALAELTNLNCQKSTEAHRIDLTRNLSRFLISLKQETVRTYRQEAVRRLAEYVNALSPDLRNLFLNNAFSLNLDAELSEGFMAGLSDQIILDALQNVSAGGNYTPPVIVKLLSRLAEERGLMENASPDGIDGEQKNIARLKTLFKADDFDNYVPKQYQDALLNIVRSDHLPNRTTEHIEILKSTLEQSVMEQHLGDILLEILRGNGSQIDAAAIRGSLAATLDFYLSSRNYGKVKEIYGFCTDSGMDDEIRSELASYFSSEKFTSAIFGDLARADKIKADEIRELIFCLGPFFIDPLLERLGEETDRSARRSYLTILLRLGEECKTRAIARLDDKRWFVTRNMLYLLRDFDDPATLPHIRRYLDHPHPKVQQEALKTCLLFKDSKAVPAMLKALESSEEGALISAIRLAGFSGDSQVCARLLSLLKKGSLMNYRLEIRKAAARALVTANPRLALPEFQKILSSGSLLHSGPLNSLKIELITLLDSYPVEIASGLLLVQVKSGSPEVTRAAQAVLVRIRGNRQHE